MKKYIEKVKENINDMIIKFDPSRKLIVLNDDIILDTCYVNDSGKELDNIAVFTLYSCDDVIFGETNFGCINLEEKINDEDDWYTLEDIVSDPIAELE